MENCQQFLDLRNNDTVVLFQRKAIEQNFLHEL